MRTETQMMRVILGKANKDQRIRAVIMNGSRANPNAPKDIFQDYDIIYIVSDIRSILAEQYWLDDFGERIMLQMPETMSEPIGDGRFTYLMLFEDGNRIDLQLFPLDLRDSLLTSDSETILLLDKDHLFERFPPASDADYLIKKPSVLEYAACCNNFWWCTQNVAKGLRRNELPYVMYMLHSVVYAELHRMIEWYIGTTYGFEVSAGKCGKYFKRYLDDETYDQYAKIYTDGEAAHLWDGLFAACNLYRDLAMSVGNYFSYPYPADDDRRMTDYLRQIRR